MLGAFGTGLATFGGVAQAFGNRKSQNRARKARLAQLNQGMKDFQLGSTDAAGNRYNFNNERGWGYDLSNSGKAAQTAANRGTYLMNSVGNQSPSQARNKITAADFRAAKTQANANQAAATRNALRTGSSTGNVAQAFGNQKSSALRNIMQQNLRNGLTAQAQIANDYAQSAQNLAANINNIQSNLQNQQNGAATQQMQLRQAMAEAAGVPKINMLQTLGKSAQGIGQAIAQYDTGNKMMNMEALKAILSSNGGNLSSINPSQITQLLALIGG